MFYLLIKTGINNIMNNLWNQFLYEAKNKYDKLSEDIMELIIQKIMNSKQKLDSKILYTHLIPMNKNNLELISLRIDFTDKITSTGHYNVDTNRIRIFMTFNEETFSYDKWFGNLTGVVREDINNNDRIDRIYEILRHELEHARQKNQPDVSFRQHKFPEDRNYYEELDYYLDETEVEAYIVQLAKREKVKPKEKRDWVQSLENFYKGRCQMVGQKISSDEFLIPKEKRKIYKDFETDFKEKINHVLTQRKWNL